MKAKDLRRIKRKKSIRGKISGTADVPRMAVHRTNQYIYVQLIDDVAGKTLAAASDLKLDQKKNKNERAKIVGTELAKLATKKKIKKVVFDRAGFKFHGRIKTLADAARDGGLTF